MQCDHKFTSDANTIPQQKLVVAYISGIDLEFIWTTGKVELAGSCICTWGAPISEIGLGLQVLEAELLAGESKFPESKQVLPPRYNQFEQVGQPCVLNYKVFPLFKFHIWDCNGIARLVLCESRSYGAAGAS